ncbi:GDSL esterase/lipase [Actinidia chinensis var. chinensis]|uniref:GDSL esterase/lipase n=1 Tax=Actinidia chinensis var. chinensis TaxID=1590841 RepID=A0A2R6QLB0_ACTCC|nr:GDSL esterase/lipase [Actinidia chinensis var. chinensis]
MRPLSHVLLFFLFLSLMLKSGAQILAKNNPTNKSVSAIFIFGDSTVDPGNNNYLQTFFKSNFLPYGRDFSNHIPTGRFTNGRLVTDYIASYVGIKENVPPYLDSTLSMKELMTGVSFASAGTGFDPLTAQMDGVIPIPQQLEYFREYIARVTQAIGEKKTQQIIKKAAFLISAGTNDFVVNYFGTPVRRQTYTVSGYSQFFPPEASYVGIKENVPPYLDSTLSMKELMTGVSFASAGTGFDPLTAQMDGVIPIPQQLEYFREYIARVTQAIGEKKTQQIIKKAAFLISAGTNDFVVNYFGTPVRRQTYTVSGYSQFLIQRIQQLVQDLIGLGAQKIAIVGLPPIGCLPAVITLDPNSIFHGRGCIESLSSIARDYNQRLQNVLKTINNNNANLVVYGDIYTPLIEMIQGRKFGFYEVNKGCCGTGLFEASILCNPHSPVCSDASQYVFWDAIHPTQETYYHVFEFFRPAIDNFLGH